MEKFLQRKIIKYLEMNDWTVLKLKLLSRNGFPDLMALKNGKTIFIEVKDTGETPKDLQALRIEQLRNNGFTAFYVDDFLTFINIFKELS